MTKLILITGVSRGLGYAMTEQFIHEGHTVVGCARSEKAVENLRKKFGSPHDFATIDVADEQQVKAWAQTVLNQYDPPDLLINNAASVNHLAPLWQVPSEEFSQVIDININYVIPIDIFNVIPKTKDRYHTLYTASIYPYKKSHNKRKTPFPLKESTMLPEYYHEQIENSEFEGANQCDFLHELSGEVARDSDIADDEKLAIELKIGALIKSLHDSNECENGDTAQHAIDRVPVKSRRVFPVYSFEDSYDLPDIVESFNGSALEYPQWFIKEYLPRFHPLPEPDIQNKIATCFALINCRAVLSKKMKLPIPYFLGLRGSGKTELGKAIAEQYLQNTTIEIRPDTTGAAMRNALDDIALSGEPCFALFDNFNPNPGYSIEKIGIHYALLLANSEDSSISRIVGSEETGKKSVYKTYGYKILTSAFDLRSIAREEAKEILRRTWTLMFKAANVQERRSMFDTQGMKDGYLGVWSNPVTVREDYGKVLGKLARMRSDKYDLPPSAWEILVVPIAVGVFTKVFTTVDDGINTFVQHYKWVDSRAKKHTVSRVDIILTDYVLGELKERGEEARENGFMGISEERADTHIKEKDLRGYLQGVLATNITRQQEEEITFLMSDWGYTLQKLGTDMYFVKDVA
ncbi:MAG: SDR family oxidoreductase [Stigonema ocellatum SAG 48.90 = DSM 106950]|nr:SDR family oxidoreductase [Stigonema ocellatum SAG 48.90 = DSM 106950]